MMTQNQWTAVDNYFEGLLIPAQADLALALQVAQAAKLPPIQVAANQGKLLLLLAQSIGARHILEIGTLGGYSTLWLARALPPDGQIITLELDPHHAQVAQQVFDQAGISHLVEIRLGAALDSLRSLEGPFDFVFIDADKANLVAYFEEALRLTRPGGLIVMDNVVRNGQVIDPASPDANVQGVRALMNRLAREPRISATALQTVGSKGYDGFALARVNG
jgi:predicted O-methyltransferase YrrM